jgi:C4-dicarboxylate transporter DctM subunit
MAPGVIGLLVFIGMFALIMIGIPIYLSMLAASLVGFLLLAGKTFAITQFFTAPFSLSATYTYCVLPLFMVLGVLASDTGIAGGAYEAAKKWTGKIRGGLMISTIVANLVFGACSGASNTAIIVFGKVAYPELEKHGYDRKLALGCIASTSALSSLIPPSTTIVLFAMLADLSIGTALMSGIGPGILCAILYILMVKFVAKFQPHKIPLVTEEDMAVTVKDKLKSLRLLVPILILFLIIVGGVFFGWFAATVGGAIGAFAVTAYAVAKRIPVKKILMGFRESGIMFAQIFPMIIGGTLFSRVIAFSGLANTLAGWISSADIAPFFVFLLVVIFYVFCGCVMDIISTIIITVPIIFPLLTGLGYNPFVICIVLVFMCEIAGLTPPLGMNVFAAANVLRLDPMVVFAGILPYFVVDLVMVILLILLPGICTFLPNLLM